MSNAFSTCSGSVKRHDNPDARCVREHVADALGIEAGKRAGGACRTEESSEARRMMAAGEEGQRVQHEVKPHAYVVAESHRAQERSAVGVSALRHRQRRGNYTGAGVIERLIVDVVGFIRMGKHAVRERSVYRRGREPARDDACFLAAADRLQIGERAFSGREAGTGNHCGDGVQQVQFDPLADVCRERFPQRTRDVAAELLHQRRYFLSHLRLPGLRHEMMDVANDGQ